MVGCRLPHHNGLKARTWPSKSASAYRKLPNHLCSTVGAAACVNGASINALHMQIHRRVCGKRGVCEQRTSCRKRLIKSTDLTRWVGRARGRATFYLNLLVLRSVHPHPLRTALCGTYPLGSPHFHSHPRPHGNHQGCDGCARERREGEKKFRWKKHV